MLHATARGPAVRSPVTLRHILLAAVLLALAATAFPTASARGAGSYYVSTSGNDSSGGSLANPWRTVQKAADTVPAGSTVYIRGGTYPAFHVRRSGTSSADTTYTNFAGESPVISGGGPDPIAVYVQYWDGPVHDVTINGLIIQNAPGSRGSGGGIVAQNAHHVIFRNNTIRNNRSFGIYMVDSTYVTISSNEITRNDIGIYVTRQGGGSIITNNRIHHNDRMVVNTSSPTYDDYGATGIAFNRSTGAISVTRNTIYGHRATSYDYDWDGSGIEIWAASNITIHRNTLYDNENVLETGTDKSMGCNNNHFTRNVAYGAPTAGRSFGLYLRCAGNMLVANNTLYGLTDFAFQISHLTGVHGGWINGLRIQNNIGVATSANHEIYWVRSALPSTVVMDRNLFFNTSSGGRIAYVDGAGRGPTSSLGTLRTWLGSGREASSIQANPSFVNAGARDFHLRTGSPAVNRGVRIAGLTDGAVAGPELGRFELR